jgi:two-component system, OmpR family, sensor histidine kinase VicK
MESSLRLLLVEDSEDDALLLLRPLRKAGYQLTVERVDTAGAMSIALAMRPWDIVISDYVLPKFGAQQALELVKAHNLDLPFIVVSGVMGEETAVAIMRAGAHDYLLKDQLVRLVPAIERELREATIRREKRKAEEELRNAYEGLEALVQVRTAELKTANESLKQLAAIVESSKDSIISTTLEGTILSWNLGAEKMYGYSASEAIGQSLSTLLLIEAENTESINNQHVVHQRKDGYVMDVFLTISPVKDASGVTIGQSWIARDITDLRAVEKLKDEFVSVVSHELRTPLTSIRASLGLLMMGKLGELPSACQQFIEIAVNNTDRLIRLINDVLDLERLESGKLKLSKQMCNFTDIMTQAIATMQGMAEAKQIQFLNPGLEIVLEIDVDRILQTLTNLLSNAIKFSPVETIVELSAIADETWIYVTVKDQGRGIPEDKLESIFGRFQQIDASDSRQQGGTGLGLAICRSIVEQHGGRIWVESTMGLGSAFRFTLPLSH